eukprot:61009_1
MGVLLWSILLLSVLCLTRTTARNTYISDNETFWRSTSEFIPINSSHDGYYAHIRLWKHMIMSLDVQFHGRVSSPLDVQWEQIFRLGWPAYSGGPLGALSRYPSLWLDNARDVFHFSLSHANQKHFTISKDFNQLTLIPTQIYSVYIEWNDTWVYFSVNDDVFLNVARDYPTEPDYIGRLLNVYIASDSFSILPPLIIANVTLRNINIQAIPPTASPTTATAFPTQHPTSMPLSAIISPTNYPTANPSRYPSLNPTRIPTVSPTNSPTVDPTSTPSLYPSHNPTYHPTAAPTRPPTRAPSIAPSPLPSATPTTPPTRAPTIAPTATPTSPTHAPTTDPISDPTADPTHDPT